MLVMSAMAIVVSVMKVVLPKYMSHRPMCHIRM